MQAIVKCATSWAGDSWHGPSIIGIQKRYAAPPKNWAIGGSPNSMHEQFQTKPCAVPSIHFIWFLSLAARSFVFLVRRLFLVQPSFSRLFFLFIYHHLLRRAPLLWQVFKRKKECSCQARKGVRKLSLSDYGAILLPVAISCCLSA